MENNNYYQIYIDAVFQLVESIVLKSGETANALNNELKVQYGPTAVDASAPSTWRYNLHLAGIYHPRDVVMTVVSMDTLEEISFTRENLAIHRGTAKAYVYGSKPFKELVNRYPDQERLITGILYPVDLTTAVNAKEGQILTYPPHLVEVYEVSFIEKLQEWVYAYLARWDNPQFRISDNLYSASVLGVMFAMMPGAVCNIRQAACKTSEAHSYHIRQYLASHGMLDSYITYLSRRQAMFLYRNIAYIERNSGKQAVFNWLVEHIMTWRNLPLAEFQMRHDLENQPTELKPLLSFNKKPLNTLYNHDLKNDFTLNEIFDKEEPLAVGNVKYRDDEEKSSISKMEYSLANKLPVKLLESSMIDYTGSEHYTLADTLFYHWLWLSSSNHYRAYITVVSPVTGENLVMTVKEAFEFYVYAFYKGMGYELEHLPLAGARRVIRTPKPTLADVWSVADKKVVSSAEAAEFLNMLPVPPVMISVDSFYDYAHELFVQANVQYKLVSNEQHYIARGQKHAVMCRCWTDATVQLGDEGQTYANWFELRNIGIDDFEAGDLIAIAEDLLQAATGVDSANALSLRDIQQAMARLLGQLSSYSIQIATSINDEAIIDAPILALRTDTVRAAYSNNENLSMDIRAQNIRAMLKSNVVYNVGNPIISDKVSMLYQNSVDFNPTVNPLSSPISAVHYHRARVGLRGSYPAPDISNNPRGLAPVLGVENYLNATFEQQMTLPDLWYTPTE